VVLLPDSELSLAVADVAVSSPLLPVDVSERVPVLVLVPLDPSLDASELLSLPPVLDEHSVTPR